MTPEAAPARHAARRWVVAAPALVYLVLGALFAWNYRYHLSSDSVVYLDMAGYMARLEFPEAFFGYWGPLLPALAAPLLALGVGPLVAGKLLAFGISFAWVLAAQRFLATRLSPDRAALGTLVGIVPVTLTVGSAYSALPDTLLGLVVLGLVATLVADARRPRLRLAALAGVLCAACYYAKTPAWILAVPPTVVCLARSRLRLSPSWGEGVRRAVPALALGAGTFLASLAPWIAGLSYRKGSFTFGSGTAVNLALRYEFSGYAAPRVLRWFPFDGERWVRHTAWAFEVDGPMPFHAGFYLRRAWENVPRLGGYLLLCPLVALGLWCIVAGWRRWLRSPRRAPIALLSLWVVAVVCATRVEWRYLLYVTPLIVLIALASPTPRWLRRARVGRTALLLLCGLIAAGSVVRYWPRRPLGLARARGAAAAARQLVGGERVWFNELASGLPVAFLMDRDIASYPPRKAGEGPPPVPPAVVVWAEHPSRPGTRFDLARTPDYEVVGEWEEEDGLRLFVLRLASER